MTGSEVSSEWKADDDSDLALKEYMSAKRAPSHSKVARSENL